MTQHLILSQYPLTYRYLEKLTDMLGERPEILVVSNITARNYLNIFKYLRSIKTENLYIPIAEESGWLLLPLLTSLSIFIGARNRHVVHQDFSLHPYGILDGVRQLTLITKGAALGTIDFVSIWFKVKLLLKTPRLKAANNGLNNILYLKTNLWLGVQAGGAIAHTNGVISGLLKNKFHVDFVSAEPPVALPENSNLKFVKLDPPEYYIVPRDLNYFTYSMHAFNQIKERPERAYNIIYQRLSTGNLTGVLVSRYLRLPLVLEYNGSETWLAKNWGRPLLSSSITEQIENACLKHASVVVTVSDVLRDELVSRGVEPERIVSHPNGVDPDIFNPQLFSPEDIAEVRDRYEIPKDAVVATFVGTFGHWHGVEVLAETLREMVKNNRDWLENSKLHILFIGDGAKRSIVEEILNDPEIDPYYTLAGLIPQDEAPLYMAASDILLSPHVHNPDKSPFFGSPTKLFEYLAMGRAVIASDLFQIGEVLKACPRYSKDMDASLPVKEDVCGILIEPREPDELAGALQFLVDNPEWRGQAGSHARRHALDKYTWDHHVSAIQERLHIVLEKDSRPAFEPSQIDRPIKVLFNALHSKSGGGVTYLENMLPLLAKDKDLEIHVCIHESQQKLLPDGIEGIFIHTLHFRDNFWNFIMMEQIMLPRLAFRINADVTFSPANFGPFITPKPIILLRNALSVASIERRPAKIAYWVMLYFGTAVSFALSKRAISVSNFASRTLGNFFTDRTTNKIAVVPHGINPRYSPPSNISKRHDFLLAVSDIYVQKNLHNLLLAVAQLKSRFPKIMLKIAGSPIDQEYYEQLQEIVRHHGLEGHVEFLGYQPPEELKKLYRSCGTFVFPSKIETFGNPLAEAMSCGAPIACSKTAAMPEVAADGAEYFDPDNVDDMAETISRLSMDEDLRAKLSQKAIKRASYYSWEKTAQKTAEIIKETALEK